MSEQSLKMITDYLESQGKLVYARNVESIGSEIAALRAQVEEYRYALEQISRVSNADGDDGMHREIARAAFAATGKEV